MQFFSDFTSAFRKDSKFQLFFLSVLTVGLSYGLYKGIIDNYLAEANRGTGLKFSPKLKFYFQWILPILILIILVQGLI